jgi:signal transduction histidine kinase
MTCMEINPRPDTYVYDQTYVLEVHDAAIQALYGLGLKLEYCIDLVDDSPEQAKAGLDGAINTIGEMISSIRTFMRDE